MNYDATNAALIQGGTQILSQGINYAATAGLSKQDRQFAKDQADLAWSRSRQAWNEQNAYNTPLNQMNRFTQAGLNKNLIYGQGSPGNAGKMDAPQMAKHEWAKPQISLPDFIGLTQSFQRQQTEIDKNQQQVINLAQDYVNKKWDSVIKKSMAGIYGWKARYAPYTESWSAEAIKNMALKRKQEISTELQRTGMLEEQLDFLQWRHSETKKRGYDPSGPPTLWRGAAGAWEGAKRLWDEGKQAYNRFIAPYQTRYGFGKDYRLK